jgi:hypothetical protein
MRAWWYLQEWFFWDWCGGIYTTKDTAWRSRNQISEYLPQRRKGRKVKETSIVPNFAFLAPWRDENPNLTVERMI